MRKITECLIKPEVARAVRDLVRAVRADVPSGNLEFLCPGCKKPVHVVGDHFEHLNKNPQCPLTPEP
ncbi:MAG TPA: hypothetical protein VEO19_13240 [Terriglobia bacterium]|nr:hypothetical protein [Terriglobia bacterium]